MQIYNYSTNAVELRFQNQQFFLFQFASETYQAPQRMHLTPIVALAMLPELLLARVLHPRAVICSFAIPGDPGDTCDTLSDRWGITIDIFKSLNPGVNCPNLVANMEYCVAGTVSPDTPSTTTTAKPTMTPTSTPTKTTTTSTATTTRAMTTTISSDAPSPTQPGLAKDCDKFHLVVSGDNCYSIQTKYGISTDQFKAWNPYINAECSNLWADYYVCVHVPGATISTSMPMPTPSGPQPQMPGIVSNCRKFHLIQAGDNCYTINQAVGITLAQFRSWNKNVNADCSNIWLGYYVCIGV
ncbi:hypothetical protein H112_03004 [Trichophyton rubrum D6]|nr:uncharacterized protein TERG_05627 [Trichophyton rubrum CBS 118892]EZF24514.1 hypothetical protein H100_03008 [Trichophyton rubrum MR850]EZF43562.1 hypothetical protein H102_03002 [Trichophyton rubrum CBS 100081]EZF54214.1 hypothetical protein H103_03016 [Trichophyton rubrum CBS 288.86]EZF64831.1 hypothetical protein H104_02996 [Trichophyton rubrum CBS 289.86]EZF86054.1 hypothetical protein H110_03010 [Trichophyton rubrum MR1448]EZF96917.1 hypothetical protein H113_03017 [Trichophyton rubr